MIKVNSEADRVCVAKAREAGQAHLFADWDDLDADVRRQLISDVQSISFQLVQRLIHQHVRAGGQEVEQRVLSPAALHELPTQGSTAEWETSRLAGEEALAAGKVALIMLAGGEGVGPLCEPAGLLPVGPVSGKSLFQLHAERIRALKRRHKTSVPWHIVTHPCSHDAVTEHFREHNYFGLNASSVRFLPQPLLPLVDRRGKLVLTDPGRLAMRPDGHGGVLEALLDDARLDELAGGGVEHLFFFQVDNALVDIANPVFIGQHVLSGVEVSSKAIERLGPGEELGIFCKSGSATGVVEYSQLPDEENARTLEDGRLAFGAGNMAVHLFSLEFLRRLVKERAQLPFHALEKTEECIDRKSRRVRPTEPNCVEFRCFLFDALWFAKTNRVYAVDRAEEFSPVKKPGGVSSPQTAQRDLSRLYAKWLRDSGARIDSDASAVEISPLYALDRDELLAKTELPDEVAGDLLLSGG